MRCLLDTEQLDELRFVLEDDFPAFIDSFVADTEIKLTELQVLFAQKSLKDGHKLAHSLKGSCLNLGANEMAQQCQRLQDAHTDADSRAQLQTLQSTWADTKAELS
ncbi:MAG: Hpt domain-containing protein [Pseudomonadales bacterium]